jgi:hypothetical protein
MGILNITDWDVISQEEFATMVFDSGVVVKNFNPSTFTAPTASDILCVTSGNITHNFKHNIVNFAEDVNNIHILPKETTAVTGYDNPTIGFTALSCTPDMFKFLLGFAQKTGGKVEPKMTVDTATDFVDLALVLKRIDGGLVAIALSNALSTGGISITTTKGGKGTFSVTITGYGTIANPQKIPVDYYSFPDVSVQLDIHEQTVAVGATFDLTASVRPSNATVTWTSDNTSEATVSSGTVTGEAVGTATITASVTVDGKTATDTCLVHVVSASA